MHYQVLLQSDDGTLPWAREHSGCRVTIYIPVPSLGYLWQLSWIRKDTTRQPHLAPMPAIPLLSPTYSHLRPAKMLITFVTPEASDWCKWHSAQLSRQLNVTLSVCSQLLQPVRWFLMTNSHDIYFSHLGTSQSQHFNAEEEHNLSAKYSKELIQQAMALALWLSSLFPLSSNLAFRFTRIRQGAVEWGRPGICNFWIFWRGSNNECVVKIIVWLANHSESYWCGFCFADCSVKHRLLKKYNSLRYGHISYSSGLTKQPSCKVGRVKVKRRHHNNNNNNKNKE